MASAFRFQEGPLFASLVLADEINRATPKTQSALLEAMQEHAVTVSGETRPLPEPYFVLATQNPIEQEGTYPLPEAQLDRFLFKVLVPFPTLRGAGPDRGLTTLKEHAAAAQQAADGAELLRLRAVARQVPMAPGGAAITPCAWWFYPHPENAQAPESVRRFLRFGASPRAAQAMLSAARVRALHAGALQRGL